MVTDLAAEAALVAEALGASSVKFHELQVVINHDTQWGQCWHAFGNESPCWKAVAGLARRLREAEQERDRWRELRQSIASLAGFADDWPEHGNAPLAIAASYALLLKDRDRWRELALEEHAPVADHCTGGYRVATEPPVPEPAYDPPECRDGTASVPVRECWDAPDWRQAQSDFA